MWLLLACVPPEDSACKADLPRYYDADGDGFGAEGEGQLLCEAGPGWVEQAGDCDDLDAATHPGAPETCDGVDHDCDGASTTAITVWADADGDGYGDEASAVEACAASEGWVENAEDCDDLDASRFPGAPETCDGVDHDCDGASTTAITVWADADGDGYGDEASAAEACAAGEGWVENAADCDDADAAVYPGAPETCDGVDHDCDGAATDPVSGWADADGDGYGDPAVATSDCALGAGWVDNDEDCDDTDAAVHPGAEELCDGVDLDCDGVVILGLPAWWDDDGDGYGDDALSSRVCEAGAGWVTTAGDCDDADPRTYPGARELCDEVDHDCDGEVPHGVVLYADADRDGYGDPGLSGHVCGHLPGFADIAGDCDDTDDSIHPDAVETCDGVDRDCDGISSLPALFYPDADGDGHGVAEAEVEACEAPAGHAAAADDCDDGDATVYPGAPETCDGVDHDCDGAFSLPAVFFPDADGDGHGDPSRFTEACSIPADHVSTADDCDDGDATVYPGAPEGCDGVDHDCDGTWSLSGTWFADADGDGFGDELAGTEACAPPTGHVANADDCDDGDASVHPGAPQWCDGIDSACDPGWTGDDGLATFVDSAGNRENWTAELAAGEPAAPVEITPAEDGSFYLCEATWYARFTLPAGRALALRGVDAAVLDAADAGEVVKVGAGAQLVVQDLTLRGGYGLQGGAIAVNGPGAGLELSGVVLEDNLAVDGAALWDGGATVLIQDSRFARNLAGDYGGALHLSGAATLDGVVFEDNDAEYGAALHVAAGGSVDISASSFSTNVATNDGGALHVAGSAVVHDGSFTDNEANAGGALWIDGGTVELADCHLEGNLADKDGGAVSGPDDAGGSLALLRTVISGNRAGWGGGLYLGGIDAVCEGDADPYGVWANVPDQASILAAGGSFLGIDCDLGDPTTGASGEVVTGAGSWSYAADADFSCAWDGCF